MARNIGTLARVNNGPIAGDIKTLTFSAKIALREVHSSNERAPAFDIMALSSDRRSWVEIGALWEFTSNSTGEVFYSGHIDDVSMPAPIDIAVFKQEDGSFAVSWRRPQRRATMPAPTENSDNELPDLPPASGEMGGSYDPQTTGDGLGESTASAPKGRGAKAKQPETV